MTDTASNMSTTRPEDVPEARDHNDSVQESRTSPEPCCASRVASPSGNEPSPGVREGQPVAKPLGQCVCACSGVPDADRPPAAISAPWIIGWTVTAGGPVPRISTQLRLADRFGSWKARWGIGRMHYRVPPGLYAVGQPTAESPVLVSANYKMSFDRLRAQLGQFDAWVLVLDTKGINVWCAAGKGTFGTDELVRRIQQTCLADVVTHHQLVVPQLGAPGIRAYQVRSQTGFRVTYGPVRAEDLPAFLRAGMQATAEMRQVQFPLSDRLAVVPVELVMSAKYVLLIMLVFFLLGGLGRDGYAWSRAATDGTQSALLFLTAFVAGTVLAPPLLPWLPGRALAMKGMWLGLALLLGVGVYHGLYPGVLGSATTLAAWCLLIPCTASFAAMNFTGSTTYTSLSGVRREVRVAVPLQLLAAAVGVALWLVGRFV